MTKQQKDNLADYLQGLKMFQPSSFPLGVIIVKKDQDKKEVEKIIKQEALDMISAEQHTDELIAQIAESINNKRGLVIDIREDHLDPKLYNQLNNLKEDLFYAKMAGAKDAVIINPVPKGGFLLLLIEQEKYRDITLGEAFTSYCNLAV